MSDTLQPPVSTGIRPLSIQIYALNFHPEPTGTGKYSSEMAAWLAAAGHHVEVICGFPYYPQWKLAMPYRRTGYRSERWSGVHLRRVPHYVPGNGRASTVQRVLIDLSFVMAAGVHAIRTLFARHPPDVIIAVCPPLFAGLWPSVIARLRRRPWLFHVQDFQVDAALQLNMLRPAWLGRVLRRMESLLLRSAGCVASITPAMCRRAIDKGVATTRIFELPNWSDLAQIRVGSTQTAFRAECGAGAGQLLVMYAGAMGRKQGLELVLDAAASLRDDPHFLFVMVGAGSEAEELRAEAERRGLGNIRFLPVQPLQRLGEMLSAADIHLVIQKADAADLVMPSKLTNIMAAGRPSVVTAALGTGLCDVVSGQNAGLVITPGSLEELLAALQRLAEDEAYRNALGRNARRYAEQALGQDAILGRLEERLRVLAAAGGAGNMRAAQD